MNGEKSYNINSAFDGYKNSIFTIENDIRFWQSFLSQSIISFKKQTINLNEVYSSIFVVYDIESVLNIGKLKAHKDSFSIKTSDLDEYSNQFFTWLMNLCILKTYNAMETLILQSIWLKYFSELKNPSKSKKDSDTVQKAIKDCLIKQKLPYDRKNNRHLIEFIKSKSLNFNLFTKNIMRIDLETTWGKYFEFISILRNIVAHNGTHITLEAHNSIKSVAKDVFERHFEISIDYNSDKHLKPIKDNFLFLISLGNEFTINTTKFIFEKEDLSFLNMK